MIAGGGGESSSSFHTTLLFFSYQICFLYKSVEVYVPVTC